MDALPQEILDEIGSYFSPIQAKGISRGSPVTSQRPALASLSRAWQLAIERQTFSTITLSSTEVDRFNEILTGHRRRLLKAIKYRIVLPSYSDVACGRFEREPDRERNDEAFTKAFSTLFEVLASWDGASSDATSSYSMELEIESVYSPKDSDYRTGPIVIGRPGDLLSTRFKYSYLLIQDVNELPVVPAITKLRTKDMKRKIAPQTTIHIASKLPNLRTAEFYGFDDERRYPEVRRRNRHALGQALIEFGLPRSLQSLSLTLGHGKPMSRLWEPPVLHSRDETHDAAGQGIRRATEELSLLRKLKVEGVVDWSLLWPECVDYTTHSLALDIIPPFWQSLEELDIYFAQPTPSGDWYFWGGRSNQARRNDDSRLPPGHGYSEEQDLSAAFQYDYLPDQLMTGVVDSLQYRSIPQADKLQPLITGFALACAQIPTLKHASVSTEVWNGGIDAEAGRRKTWMPWGIWYAAPGLRFHQYFEEHPQHFLDISRRRLVLDVGDWHPDSELLELLRSIGQRQHPGQMLELSLNGK